MADKTQSDSDAARITRGTLPVKIKRKQPFVLESFLSHADGGRTKANIERMKQSSRSQAERFRQMLSFTLWTARARSPWSPRRARKPWVALQEKGDFFGEGCLTGQPRRIATVTAIKESKIMRLDKAAMVRALHDEPKFSELFMSHLSLGMSALKRTWSISCSIRARSAWRGCFY